MVVISDVKTKSMFWGVTIDAGKRYSQTVTNSFHLSMAALEPSKGSEHVQVMIQHSSAEFLLCTLQPGKLLQQPLDLIFVEGEEVSFSLVGKGIVHLTGYLLPDQEEETFSDEDSDEELDAPQLVEMDADVLRAGQKRKALTAASPAKKTKLLDSFDEEDYDSDEDEDYEGFEDSDDEDDDDEEEDDDDDEFSEDDLTFDEDEDDDDEEDESEEESPVKPKVAIETPKSEKVKKAIETPKSEKVKKAIETPKSEKVKKQKDSPKTPKTPKEVQTPQKSPETPSTPANGESSKKKKKKKKKSKDEESPSISSVESTPKSASKGKDKSKGDTPKSASKDKKNTPTKPETPGKRKVVAGGTVVEDLKVGHGPEAKSGKMVSVYYTGTLTKNNTRFDSCTGGKPFRFRLKSGDVIKGWDNGVEGMKVGGKRKITVPANQGYGGQRQGPIPPNSSLTFEVELKAVS